MSLHQTITAFTVFGTFLEAGDRRFSVHLNTFSHFSSSFLPICLSLFFLKAQAEERAAVLRAQLEERKKAILQRINQEGKEKLEKVLYYFALLLNLLSLSM